MCCSGGQIISQTYNIKKRESVFFLPGGKTNKQRYLRSYHLILNSSGRIQPDFPGTVCVSDSSDSTWRSSSSAHESHWSLQKVNVFNVQTCLFLSVFDKCCSLLLSSSTLESLQCVRAAHRQHWSCLRHAGTACV